MELKRFRQIVILIAFAILLFVGLENFSTIGHVLGWFLGLCFPFVLGSCIAFILNVPMSFIESKLLQNFAKKSLRRILSLLLTLLLVISVIVIAVGIIMPQIGESFESLGIACKHFYENLQIWASETSVQYPTISEFIATINFDWRTLNWEKIMQTMTKFASGTSDFLGSTFLLASSVIGGFVNFFIGLFFSIYILLQKEILGRQVKKILYALLSQKYVSKTLDICKLAHKTFSNFITGQCAEAIILGLMFFICMSLFQFPYAVLVGVLIAITALIPIFGAFIGCAVGAFLILVTDPIRAIWFIILFLILQQIEGNLIYPHVVGNSVGLPAIWVLVAVTVGGSMMGIVGMLICIPLFSVLYSLIRTATNAQLQKKNVSPSCWGDSIDESNES